MANQPLRIMLRLYFGRPFLQASEDERRENRERMKQLLKKRKSSDIKLIGAHTTYGWWSASDGHHLILEVDSQERVDEINMDIVNSRILLEKYNIDIGQPQPPLEKAWEEI